jgi:exodeoxyribonuclease VII small subunit
MSVNINEEPTATMTAIENLSFRAGSEELERIVRQLEGNQLELEDSLVLYERGIKLLAYLQGQLDSAEQKVTVLLGELASADNNANDEDVNVS